MNNKPEVIARSQALEWILQEKWNINKGVGVHTHFLTGADIPKFISEYNKHYDTALRRYSVEESDQFAKQKTLEYMKQLQQSRRDDVQLY